MAIGITAPSHPDQRGQLTAEAMMSRPALRASRRFDVSSFHSGLLTERHVDGFDTTYNLIARRYLPLPIAFGERLRWNVWETLRLR